MKEEKKIFVRSLLLTLSFVILIWLIKIFEVAFDQSFTFLGLLPKDFSGIWKIFTYSLIHKDFEHLFSNSITILLLGTGILFFYRTSAVKVILFSYIIPGVLLWFFGRHAYHIGASGMVYSFVTFLFFSGIIRRDKRAIVLALIVTFLYGSLVWGILPLDPAVSWEGHLFGAISGIAAAIIFRKFDPVKKYEWEDDDDNTPVNQLEINYDDND
jgi:membrane associated rhomboid family serine protease